MKKTSPMRKLYDSRLFWMIVSFLAALAMWVYFSSTDAEEMTKIFRGVRVELVGEDELRNSRNMVITDLDTNSVTVEVTGPRRIIGGLDSGDLIAQVDVSRLTQAAYTSQTYDVVFPDGTDKKNITVTRKTPETANFMASQQSSRTIPVRGTFDAQPADGYTAEMPVFEPSTITITGPEVYINSVSYAWVTFGEDGITSTYSVDTGYTLMDSNGDECSTTGITCSTDTIKATLPLLMVKEVPLTVDTIEGAGATSANTVIKIEPSSITLAGDTSILAGMNKIVLGTIDLTDFTDAFQNTYSIVLDNEVRNLTGITEAKVTVEIIGLETRDFTVTNLSCINDTEGYKSTIITESLTVTLRGTKEQLDAIQSENIRAVADLKDFKESSGTYMVPVKVYVAGYDDVGAIGDVTMSVELRKA